MIIEEGNGYYFTIEQIDIQLVGLNEVAYSDTVPTEDGFFYFHNVPEGRYNVRPFSPMHDFIPQETEVIVYNDQEKPIEVSFILKDKTIRKEEPNLIITNSQKKKLEAPKNLKLIIK